MKKKNLQWFIVAYRKKNSLDDYFADVEATSGRATMQKLRKYCPNARQTIAIKRNAVPLEKRPKTRIVITDSMIIV